MRLVVKENGLTINELQFKGGPVHIGRHADSQIFLPNRLVSRHHAVIFNTQDGKWMVEDLDSVNKTYLNNELIHKAETKTGDVLRIADYTIELDFENDLSNKAINLQDTLSKTAYDLEDTFTASAKEQIITRRIDAEHAPDIKLPFNRAKDFMKATEAICRANGLDEVLQALLNIMSRQFDAFHVWCALRSQSSGPMTCHAGRKRDGSSVELSDIKLNEKVTEAVEKNIFLLLPKIPHDRFAKQTIKSAMIGPIVGHAGSFGVLYIDNDMAHEHYNLGDLDYLILLLMHTSVIIENF
jgi:hypothetical protein